ncbi:hypothetical protein [Mailhella massiliensis]|uniref:Ribosome maturation factor RimP n=1 Tax=Mailhella massiliensis TaxID=1903261 RepID=A0A921AUH1_9BACT|nr:hypothetical protein [Mailhella massiliensis]HJD96136.1 hypothetical protein [Mailhella massiliensis]
MGKGLSAEQIVRRVREAAEPVIASFGLMLWGIEVVAGGRTVVRVYVDAPAGGADAGTGEDGVLEGVSVDQCAEISRMVGLALDVDEVFSDAWVLEVSSPGMDRMFFEPAQLVSYVGSDIDVTLTDPHPDIAGRRKFKGPLKSVSDKEFIMEVLLVPASGEKPEPAEVTIRWNQVKKARLIPVFPDTSKPGAGKNAKHASGKGGGNKA